MSLNIFDVVAHFKASLSSIGSSAVINATISQLGRRLEDRSRPRTSEQYVKCFPHSIMLRYILGHVLRISPVGSVHATVSKSRLISRRHSNLANFPLILSRPTTSTSIIPLEEPRITFSCDAVPCCASIYLEERAFKNDRP